MKVACAACGKVFDGGEASRALLCASCEATSDIGPASYRELEPLDGPPSSEGEAVSIRDLELMLSPGFSPPLLGDTGTGADGPLRLLVPDESPSPSRPAPALRVSDRPGTTQRPASARDADALVMPTTGRSAGLAEGHTESSLADLALMQDLSPPPVARTSARPAASAAQAAEPRSGESTEGPTRASAEETTRPSTSYAMLRALAASAEAPDEAASSAVGASEAAPEGHVAASPKTLRAPAAAEARPPSGFPRPFIPAPRPPLQTSSGVASRRGTLLGGVVPTTPPPPPPAPPEALAKPAPGVSPAAEAPEAGVPRAAEVAAAPITLPPGQAPAPTPAKGPSAPPSAPADEAAQEPAKELQEHLAGPAQEPRAPESSPELQPASTPLLLVALSIPPLPEEDVEPAPDSGLLDVRSMSAPLLSRLGPPQVDESLANLTGGLFDARGPQATQDPSVDRGFDGRTATDAPPLDVPEPLAELAEKEPAPVAVRRPAAARGTGSASAPKEPASAFREQSHGNDDSPRGGRAGVDLGGVFDTPRDSIAEGVDVVTMDDAEVHSSGSSSAGPSSGIVDLRTLFDAHDLKASGRMDDAMLNLSGGLFGGAQATPLAPIAPLDLSAPAPAEPEPKAGRAAALDRKAAGSASATRAAEPSARPGSGSSPAIAGPATRPPPPADPSRLLWGVGAVALLAVGVFLMVREPPNEPTQATVKAGAVARPPSGAVDEPSLADPTVARKTPASTPLPHEEQSPVTTASAAATAAGTATARAASAPPSASPGNTLPASAQPASAQPAPPKVAVVDPKAPAPRVTATAAPTDAPATPPPEAAPPAVLVIAPPQAGGGGEFDKSAAKAALSSAAGAASGCHKGDDPLGIARVSVTFAPSGRVTSAKILGPPFTGTATGSCVASSFRSVSVPPFDGSPVSVTKEVSVH